LRTSRGLLVSLAAASILFAACGSAASPTPAPATPAPATPAPATEAPSVAPTEAPTAAPASIPLGCQVSDTGGIDDKGFNANAWKGMQDAQAAGYVKDVKFLESTAATDYQRNIDQFVSEGCDIITTVGFLLGDDTAIGAAKNPTQKFSIVDFAYGTDLTNADQKKALEGWAEKAGVSVDAAKTAIDSNILGLTFQTDQAAMLAGYLAAGMSKSGAVGTFGGINIPPVTIFMDGLASGINYYNKEKGTSVKLLGWDAVKKNGSFTGDFSDKDKGKQLTQGFIQEGADIIVPVAGPVGLGAAAAVQEAKDQGVMLIGVDTDQYVSAPEYGNVTLTSILKRIDNAVKASVQAAADGSFKGGVYSGTLANEGVGLAPFHDFDAAVPADLKAAIADLATKISSGAVKVADFYAPAQ
jgi:basic membrane protein A